MLEDADSIAKSESSAADSEIAGQFTELNSGADRQLSEITGPEISCYGSTVVVNWPSRAISFRLAGLSESGSGISAEITVTCSTIPVNGHVGRVHWGRGNLASLQFQENLIRKLSKKIPLEAEGSAWRFLIERSFYLAAETFRQGEPVVELAECLDDAAEDFGIEPIVPKNETAFLYADGGSGKSYLSLFLAVSFALGRDLPGGIRTPQPGAVMILDWESTREETQRRLTRICKGLGVSIPKIAYRTMKRPLLDDLERISQEVVERDSKLLILDSWQPACGSSEGGEPSGRTVATLNALRGLKVSTLAIAHLSKADAQSGGTVNKIYGSVFAWNLGRSIWELRGSQDDQADALNLSLFHRKVNGSRLRHPIGLRIAFDSGMVLLHGFDYTKDHGLMAGAALPFRVLDCLRDGAMTVKEIAEITGAAEGTIRKSVWRLSKQGKVVSRPPRQGGKSPLWALSG
jgi:AAA domain